MIVLFAAKIHKLAVNAVVFVFCLREWCVGVENFTYYACKRLHVFVVDFGVAFHVFSVDLEARFIDIANGVDYRAYGQVGLVQL